MVAEVPATTVIEEADAGQGDSVLGSTIINGDDAVLMGALAESLRAELAAAGAAWRPVVVCCIGTDRSTGDALGPLVGEALLSLGMDPSGVLGDLGQPLHALNLAERLRARLDAVPSALVIAVDAALGPVAEVGTIRVRRGGIRPGIAVGKDLPEVGEISVTAIVNVSGAGFDAQVLQSTRLFVVQRLARLIAAMLWWGLNDQQVARPQAHATSAPPKRLRRLRAL